VRISARLGRPIGTTLSPSPMMVAGDEENAFGLLLDGTHRHADSEANE
jgi:hypothetical protein